MTSTESNQEGYDILGRTQALESGELSSNPTAPHPYDLDKCFHHCGLRFYSSVMQESLSLS